MPLDHISLTLPPDKLDPCVDFYKQALAPIDYEEVMRFEHGGTVVGVGLGAKKIADFWLVGIKDSPLPPAQHFAFAATSA